jgi:hypothetical protein
MTPAQPRQPRPHDDTMTAVDSLTHSRSCRCAHELKTSQASDPWTGEPFRSVDFLDDIALASIVGRRGPGYIEALELLAGR